MNDWLKILGYYRKIFFIVLLLSLLEWYWIYIKKFKYKEKFVDEKLKKVLKKKFKNKFLSREERDCVYKVLLIKRIKKFILLSVEFYGFCNIELYFNVIG